MESPQDAHQQDTASFWSMLPAILAVIFGGFALFVGVAFILGGLHHSLAGKPQAAAPGAPAPASAPTPAVAAAPASPAPVATVNGVAIVVIKPGAANPMSYDTTSFVVKAGQPVKLTFTNEQPIAPLQHNLILCKIGSKQRMLDLANSMMTDVAKWLPKGFIPESPDIIVHTRLLNPKESETLEFKAPSEKGDYPYLCTFPGHSIIMNGVMKVE